MADNAKTGLGAAQVSLLKAATDFTAALVRELRASDPTAVAWRRNWE